MTMKSVTIRIPEPVYKRLQEIANATGLSLEEVVVRCIEVSLPRFVELALLHSRRQEGPEDDQPAQR
jgi:predicted transcriptional regulator